MKKTGTILVVMGLLLTLFAGFNFMSKKKVMDIGTLEIIQNQNHTMNWSPYVGVVLMVVGGVVYLFSNKKR